MPNLGCRSPKHLGIVWNMNFKEFLFHARHGLCDLLTNSLLQMKEYSEPLNLYARKHMCNVTMVSDYMTNYFFTLPVQNGIREAFCHHIVLHKGYKPRKSMTLHYADSGPLCERRGSLEAKGVRF